MKHMHYIGMIEDASTDRCTEAELNGLLHVFEHAVKRVQDIMYHQMSFDLKEFDIAGTYGVDHFTLQLERQNLSGPEQWMGTFNAGNKGLRVLGKIMK